MQVSRNGTITLPFTIRFRERAVVGPSAGLAYALAIDDILDPADVARGRTLAATGVVRPDGRVEAVGFVGLKASAAHDSGARLFLVPDGEFGSAVGQGLDLHSVTSLADALAALR